VEPGRASAVTDGDVGDLQLGGRSPREIDLGSLKRHGKTFDVDDALTAPA